MRQDPVSHYGYINAKLRAKIGLMRERGVVELLLRSESLVDAVSVLRTTPYHQVSEAYDRTGDLQQMEFVLLTLQISMYREVEKSLNQASGSLVKHLLGKIEVDNLKNVLRLWYSSIIRHRPIRHRSEYLFKQQILHPVDWVALINATSYKEVCQAVKETPYASVLHTYGLERLEQEGLFSLESELDSNWYLQLIQCTEILSNNDRKIALDIFNFEIDLRNILILVRYGWYRQMEENSIKPLLLSQGNVIKSKDIAAYIKQKPSERNPQPLIDRFLPGFDQVASLTRGSVQPDQSEVLETLKIEAHIDKMRKLFYQKLLAADPFSIALPLSYFFLFKEETTMIKAILNGKYYGYDEQYIRGVLG